MTDIAFIDFETRSATDIKLGVDRYAKDLECEVLMLAYKLPGSDEIRQWHRGPHLDQDMAPPQDLFDHIAAGGVVSAWNLMFEFHIWAAVCTQKYGWPELPLEQCRDTMAMAAAMNLPQGLGRCAEVLGLPGDQQKDKRGKYLIQRLCVPHKPTKTRASKWVEDPELFAEFLDYNRQDVVVEMAIAKKLRPLSEFEQQVWLLTQRINLRGIPLAIDEIEVITDVVEREKERLNGELERLTHGQVLAASKRADLLAWCNSQMEDFTSAIDFIDAVEDEEDRPGHEEPLLQNMRGKTVEEVLKRDDLPANVRRALEIRALVVQTSTAKFAKMLKIVSADGTAKNMFVYHGAGPGRWASRGGLNVQNFARPTVKQSDIDAGFALIAHGVSHGAREAHEALLLLFGDKVMDVMVSLLRGVLKTPEGEEFIDADYSSVENRVGVWLAGQDDKLEMFRKGFDEYRVFASRSLYGVPYDQVTGDMRQMAKSAVLGCLFGQGWKGLIEYAKGYGVTLTPERSQEVVKAYRDEYELVKKLWYICGDASVAAVQNPGEWVAAGDKLELCCHRNFLWMRLPSGRLIAWASPRIVSRLAPWTKKRTVLKWDAELQQDVEHEIEEPVYKDCVSVEGIDQKTRQWTRFDLIGSSIFQSAVQGTARDVIAHGVMQTEAAGYPTVLLAHDENMARVPVGFGSEEEFGTLMCKKAEWFADLPLAYEAWRDNRFKK